METVTQAQLNRTYLSRQRLLTKSDETSLDLIKALGAVQAQEGPAPYFALWARSSTFDREELDAIRFEKKAVRTHLHRNTVHLLATDDFLAWYPLYMEKLQRQLSKWGPDYNPVTDWLPRLTEKLNGQAQRPKTVEAELDLLLPGADKSNRHMFHLMAALELVRSHGPAGESLGGQERWLTSETYLGMRPVEGNMESMIHRYLNGYGPASPADFSAWSGLPSQRKYFEDQAEAGAFLTYEDDRGRVLYDLPSNSLLTGEEQVTPAQLLGDFDNAILSHQDRRRIVSDEVRTRMNRNLRSMAPMMLDGYQVGVWQVRLPKKGSVQAALEPFSKISKAQKKLLTHEAERALSMAAPARDSVVLWAS